MDEKDLIVSVSTNNGLRADLMRVYNDLRNGNINKGTAKEIANVAGKAKAVSRVFGKLFQ